MSCTAGAWPDCPEIAPSLFWAIQQQSQVFVFIGDPDRIRTYDPQIRKLVGAAIT
jgi:hypothetical protein